MGLTGSVGLLSLTLFVLLDLAEERVDAVVDAFFKGVAYFFGMELGAGEGNVESGLLVLGCFGLDYLEYKFGLDYAVAGLFELACFL